MRRRKDLGPYFFELDEQEMAIYSHIKMGIQIVSKGDKNITNILTRLRRNGLIENHGTRSHPEWKTSDNWKKWPYNYHSTIVLPDEDNRDEFLVQIDDQIESLTVLIGEMKRRRGAYIAKQDREARVVRNSSGYRSSNVKDQPGRIKPL